MWLNRSSRIWRSRVQSPAHFWLKQSHLFRGLCPREMASWGQTPFFWSSERMLVCRTIGLSPLFEFNQKNVYSQNNWTRGGGGGCPREMAELQDPNSTVMGSMPVKTFYSGLLLEKNLFQMLLAPLCPRVTRSSARSCGARFSFQLWRAGFNAGSSELGSIPAIANSNWSSISFDENLYASISSLSARNGKSWSTFRWLVVDLLSRWTGFDPGSSELFLSLSCCRKRLFCSSSLFVRAKRQVLLGSFSGVRGFECRCW